MKATWDSGNNQYVASGFFDNSNMSYVPGRITIEYAKKRETVTPGDNIDFMASHFVDSLSSVIKDSAVMVVSNTPTEQVYNFQFSAASELEDLAGKGLDLIIKTTEKIYGSDLSDYMGAYDNFFSYLVPGHNDSKYIANLDYTDPDTYNMIIHDISSNKIIDVMLRFDDNNIKLGDYADKLSQVSYVTGMISDMYGIIKDDGKLRNDIMSNPNLSSEQRAVALRKADELKRDREMFLLMTAVITVATMSTGGMVYAPIIFSTLFGAITGAQGFFWNMRMANIVSGGSGMSFNFRWAIDPSGYVYEGVTTNRLTGVKTTAYFKENEGDTPIVWDALEWEQFNPLYTDINGAYAWDVPEGLWQVKFEFDDYVTTYSEWLPVPPPQTDVNIGMVSLAAPQLECLNIYDTYVEVRFDKYMIPDSITPASLTLHEGSINIPYTLEYSTDEKDLEGNVFARTYILRYSDNYTAVEGTTYTVSITSDAKSYAGVNAMIGSRNGSKENNVGIEVLSEFKVVRGESSNLSVKITSYSATDNITIKCESSDGDIVEVGNVSAIQEDGTFTVELIGKLLGVADITISIVDTNISANTSVTVSESSGMIVTIADFNVARTGEGYDIFAILASNSDTLATICVALYDDNGQLLVLSLVPKVLTGTATESLSESISFEFETTQSYKVKIFVWETLNNMIPISEVYEKMI